MLERTTIATAKRLTTVRDALRLMDENLELAIGQLEQTQENETTSSFDMSDLVDIQRDIRKPLDDLWYDLHVRLEQLTAKIAETSSEGVYELEKASVLTEVDEVLRGKVNEN